jgi:serine/threonine-protein kinase
VAEDDSLAGLSRDPLVGQIVAGRFTVLELIDRGGMAKVYRAEQASLGRDVALKVLDPEAIGDTPDSEKRFYQEAAACSKLSHPNTVTIFDYGATPDGIYFIAMELLEGRSLVHALRYESPMPPVRAVHIAAQIARSLREAHRHGIVHRDLKPANVLLVHRDDSPDFVKVLDFGLAQYLIPHGDEQLSEDGLFLGTPRYTAPERIRGDPIDPRCDLYSLGILLHEMITGKQLFAGADAMDVFMAQLHLEPPPLARANTSVEVPEALDRVVRRCLEKDPRARFADMDALLDAFRELGGPEGPIEFLNGDASSNGSIPLARLTPLPPPGGGLPTDLAPTVSLAAVELNRPKRHARRWLVAALAALSIGGGGSLIGAHLLKEPVATVGAVPPRPAREPELMVVRLRSAPSGARVMDGERLVCAATPCELSWPREAGASPHVTFRFELRGTSAVEVTRQLDRDEVVVSATLPKSRPKPRALRKAPRHEKQEAALDRYKENPY